MATINYKKRRTPLGLRPNFVSKIIVRTTRKTVVTPRFILTASLLAVLGILCWKLGCQFYYYSYYHYYYDSNGIITSWNDGRLRGNQGQLAVLLPTIPSYWVPRGPVKVRSRDDIDENDVSYKAYRAFGEELRQLLSMEGARAFLQQESFEISSSDNKALQNFQNRLYSRAPWLQRGRNNSGLPKPVNGKAIVICAGDKQLPYLRSLLYAIRVVHKSTIPIRIVFRDNDDLSTMSQTALVEFIPKNDVSNDIQFINLADIFDLKAANLKAGWNLKPFGLLAVAETEIIVMDVDVVLLQPPEKLFQAQGYQETGALFYHDRMFFTHVGFYDPGALAEALQPNLSSTAKSIIHFGKTQYRAEHIMESGVVLIDRGRRLLGIWAVCLLIGRQDIREHSQALYVYGDKEMYWIGFETVSEPYTFAKYYPGVYGGVATNFAGTDFAVSPTDDKSKVSELYEKASSNQFALCGRILHLDDFGQPLWSNGGYFTKEEDWRSSIFSRLAEYPLNPVWYVDGGKWLEEEFLPHVLDRSLAVGWLASWFTPKDNPKAFAILKQAHEDWNLSKTKNTMNQQWQTHDGMGVMCLLANSRGVQQVPDDLSDAASKATMHFFLSELKTTKYAHHWKAD